MMKMMKKNQMIIEKAEKSISQLNENPFEIGVDYY